MTEKRVLLASALSIAFLAIYTGVMAKMYPASQRKPVSAGPAAITAQQSPQKLLQPLEDEHVIPIESAKLRLEIGERSASVRRVTIKDFAGEGNEPLTIASHFPLLAVHSGDEPLSWKLAESGVDRAAFVSSGAKQYHISYQLVSDKALLEIVLSTSQASETQVQLVSVWAKADNLSDRNNPLETSSLQQAKDGKITYKRTRGSLRAERNVPRGTSMLALSERYFCQIIKPQSGELAVTLLPSPMGSIASKGAIGLSPGTAQSVSVYFGPRDYFHLQQVEMEKAFGIGALGQIGLILLKILSMVARLTKNYGIAIILFGAGITLMMSPFTLLGMRSMKKMQALKPQIDKIMEQHKDDPTRANREVFALYREHKISPMSGCLPLFLQMPIFIALFQAITHYIELRGASFLWIKDLSLSDRAGILPFHLPIFGNELNVLPLIMACAMFLQTKLQSRATGGTGAQQDPTAKLLQGPFMAIMFGVMFYHFPAGLVLYWLTNNLVSIVLYRLAK